MVAAKSTREYLVVKTWANGDVDVEVDRGRYDGLLEKHDHNLCQVTLVDLKKATEAIRSRTSRGVQGSVAPGGVPTLEKVIHVIGMKELSKPKPATIYELPHHKGVCGCCARGNNPRLFTTQENVLKTGIGGLCPDCTRDLIMEADR